jgi:hypothetical protein
MLEPYLAMASASIFSAGRSLQLHLDGNFDDHVRVSHGVLEGRTVIERLRERGFDSLF